MVMSGHDTRDSIGKRNNNKKRPVVKPEFNFVGGAGGRVSQCILFAYVTGLHG